MVQIPAMKRVKGRAPLSVVVAIIGGLALAGIIFTEDLRSLTGTLLLERPLYCCTQMLLICIFVLSFQKKNPLCCECARVARLRTSSV